MEAVTNIRTVSSFGNDTIILGIYDKKLEKPSQIANRKGIYAGIGFGFSQGLMFCIEGLIFYIGALFYRDIPISIDAMFTTIFALMFAAMAVGNNNQFAGDIGLSLNAAQGIFKLLLEEDEMQKEEKSNSQKLTTTINGDIEFRGITFQYPQRDKIIFDNFNIYIRAGQRVAFVGPSGCGKSTILGLLLRFYEP